MRFTISSTTSTLAISRYPWAIWPNPFSDGTLIGFSLPTSGRVDVSVFDVNGRLVQRLEGGTLVAGEHHLWWDGRDVAGRPVAGGVYFSRIEAEGWKQSVKLMVVR